MPCRGGPGRGRSGLCGETSRRALFAPLAMSRRTRESPSTEMASKTRLLRDDDLRELLASRGIRVTEQRMVILRELARLRVPTSHPELTERIAGEGLDRATIYRNLLSLTEAGLLVKTQLGDSVWRFELPQSSSPQQGAHGAHPHFVCSDCGTVACLPSSSVALRGLAARNQVADVQLRGRCVDCVRA
jgi:Fur family ferric uptake transcriptional regulator